MLGGPNLIVWLVLAFGGAMFVGNVAALVRPPARTKDAALAHAPRRRTIAMACLGALVSVWAVASLLR